MLEQVRCGVLVDIANVCLKQLQNSSLDTESVPHEKLSTVPPVSKQDNLLNSILDTGRESFSLDSVGLGGFGLGFRAALPKLPSFRVSMLYCTWTYHSPILLD
jgi:hypothetical protein